jgi:hypothetical protein
MAGTTKDNKSSWSEEGEIRGGGASDVWDEDALLNPYAPDLEEGRRQGREDGLAAGYRDGRSLGQTTGLEHGLEVGFVRGCVEAIRRQLPRFSESSTDGDDGDSDGVGHCSEPLLRFAPAKLKRMKKMILELSALLDDFPGPSEIFSNNHAETIFDESGPSVTNQQQHEVDSDDDDEEEIQATSEGRNVRSKLQRIRARFKLLTVQLRIPHFSLAHVMEEAARDSTGLVIPPSQSAVDSDGASARHQTTTTEW